MNEDSRLTQWAHEMLTEAGIRPETADLLDQAIILLLIVLIAWAADLVCRFLILGVGKRIAAQADKKWKGVLVERSVAWPYMVPFLGPGKARGNDFVFPIYFDEDPVHQFERITYANNVINQSLQRVAKRIGLTRKVTFYAARHTYASRLYHADVPLPLIAQNMGRNPAEIETYLKEFDTDKIISANKRIWQIPRTEPLETNTGGL